MPNEQEKSKGEKPVLWGGVSFWVYIYAFAIGLSDMAAFAYAFYNVFQFSVPVSFATGAAAGIVSFLVIKSFQGGHIRENYRDASENGHAHAHAHEHENHTLKKHAFTAFYFVFDSIGSLFLFLGTYAWAENIITGGSLDFYSPTTALLIGAVIYEIVTFCFSYYTEVKETHDAIDGIDHAHAHSTTSNASQSKLSGGFKAYRTFGSFTHALEHFAAAIAFIPPTWIKHLFQTTPEWGYIGLVAVIIIAGGALFIQSYYFDGDAFQKNWNPNATLNDASSTPLNAKIAFHKKADIAIYIGCLLHGFTAGFSVFLLSHELLPAPLKAYCYLSFIIIAIAGFGNYISEGKSAIKKNQADLQACQRQRNAALEAQQPTKRPDITELTTQTPANQQTTDAQTTATHAAAPQPTH